MMPIIRDCMTIIQSLIALRTGNPVLFTESATFSMACNSNNWQNGRTMVSIADGKEPLYCYKS